MKYFTQDEFRPSESTIRLIKQIAYTYNAMKMTSGKAAALCLN